MEKKRLVTVGIVFLLVLGWVFLPFGFAGDAQQFSPKDYEDYLEGSVEAVNIIKSRVYVDGWSFGIAEQTIFDGLSSVNDIKINDRIYIIFYTDIDGGNIAKRISKTPIEPYVAPVVRKELNKLSFQNPKERIEAANNLGKIGSVAGKKVLEPLIVALNDGDIYVQRSAALALGNIGDAYAIESLIYVLKNGNDIVRESAARALGMIRDTRATEPLMNALKDESNSVRDYAASALGQIRDIHAIEPLIIALNDKNKYAADALIKITGQNFGEKHDSWQNWWQHNKEQFK